MEAEFLALWPSAPEGALERFLRGSEDDQRLVVATIKDIGNAPDPSAWDRFLVVLGAVSAVANPRRPHHLRHHGGVRSRRPMKNVIIPPGRSSTIRSPSGHRRRFGR